MDYDEGWGRWGDNGGVEIEMLVALTYSTNPKHNTQNSIAKIISYHRSLVVKKQFKNLIYNFTPHKVGGLLIYF